MITLMNKRTYREITVKLFREDSDAFVCTIRGSWEYFPKRDWRKVK